MNCQQTRQKIVAYVDGEIEGEERRIMTEHLASCASCFRRATFEGNFNRLLRDGIAEEEVPPRILDRVRRGLGESRSARVRRRLWSPVAGYAVAAVLLLALAVPPLLPVLVPWLTPVSSGAPDPGGTVAVSGVLVCIQCDRDHAAIENQRACRSVGHATGLRTEAGAYWALANQGPGANLHRQPALRGSRVRLHGTLYPGIETLDVRRFEIG